MQTIVIDANFLMSAYRFKVDAIGELKALVVGDFCLVAPTSVVRELERLSESRGAAGPGAAYALEVMRREKVKILPTEKSADDWIEEYCKKTGAIACTNDAQLKQKLKKHGLRVISLIGKSKLDYV